MRIRNVLCLGLLAIAGSCNDEESAEPRVPGVARDDMFTIGEDEVSFDLGMALDNDDEQVGPIFTLSEPAHGTVTRSIGYQTYQPEPGFFGTETLVYEASNGADGTTTATIQIVIESDRIGYEHSQLVDTHKADALAVGDIDGDGKPDLVTCDDDANAVAILLDRTTAPESYAFEPSRFEGGRSPRAIVTSDVDRDGKLDVVTASAEDGGLVVLRNATAPGATPSFAAPVIIPSTGSVAVVALDVDGDGREDLVSLEEYRHLVVHMSASTGPGDMTFAPGVEFETPSYPKKLLVTDLDDDGRPDLVVLAATGQISLFVNNTTSGGPPVFAARVDRATAPNPQSAVLVDLDDDGQDEIVVLHATQPMWIYVNRGTPGSLQYEAARIIDVGANAAVARAMDLDADGKTDLLVGYDSVGYTHLLNRSTGAGSFELAPEFARVNVLGRGVTSQGKPTAIAVADLDGSGEPEIVVTASQFPSSGGALVLYGP